MTGPGPRGTKSGGPERVWPDGTAVVPQEVSFPSQGRRLKGYLYLAPRQTSVACIVHNHGSRLRPGTKEVSRPQSAALMLSWGYAFFFPHRRGYGESPGRPLDEAVPAALGTTEHDTQITARLEAECDDVVAAIDFVSSHPAIDGDRLALFGSSRGGILSLLAAARDERIRACVNFCGGARQWAAHPRLRERMLAAARTVGSPVFLAQAANDFNTAATTELAEELRRARKEHECRIYPAWGRTPEEGHAFEPGGALVWGPDVRDFLRRSLR